MKKAVITLLGMLSHTKPECISIDGEIKKVFIDIPEKDRATYYFCNNLDKFSTLQTKERYINTLPLLIDIFEDRDIISISTQKAKDVQEKTLKFLKLDTNCLDNTVLIDESDYEDIFQKISETLQDSKYESFIIDLTHGFRHLPILMIVNLIISSIKDVDKIEHIFFAKEKVAFKEYEIIDLLDYIDLAILSFVLENFNTNYTVGNKLLFKNEKYQSLVDSLRIISSHILANSIKTLMEKDKSLINQTIIKLNDLKQSDKNIATFTTSIDNIIKHLNNIEQLKDEKDYIKLFKLSQMMKDREYLLNSITLLNESIGLYCAEIIRQTSPDVCKQIDLFLEQDKNFPLYNLSNQSKKLLRFKNGFQGAYLSTNFSKSQIIKFLNTRDDNSLRKTIKKVQYLRDNLAHGNSSDTIENVKLTIGQLLKNFQTISKIK